MLKHILIVVLFCGCKNTPAHKNHNSKIDSTPDNSIELPPQSNSQMIVNYDHLKEYLITSDSVILFSHHSPNEPIKNTKTGEYHKKSIPFIEAGKINYAASVQEQKKMNNKQINELIDILILPVTDDGIAMACFQPRNAIVAFKKGQIAYFDFCFDCYDFLQEGDWGSGLVMNSEKYKKLFLFYKRLGFKYGMN